MSWKIAIIGTGNLGRFWINFLRKFSQNELRAQSSSSSKTDIFCNEFNVLAYNPQDNWLPDLILLCVQDDRVKSLLSKMSSKIPVFVHGGSLSLNDLERRNLGIIYPLQSIHMERATDVESISFLCEFPPDVQWIGKKFMNEHDLSHQEVNEQQRHAAHIAAIFINNFGYFIIKEGLQFAQNKGVDPELFQSLLKVTYNNILINKDLQTGPARRGDLELLQKHYDFLPESYRNLYQFLSGAIQNKYKDEL